MGDIRKGVANTMWPGKKKNLQKYFFTFFSKKLDCQNCRYPGALSTGTQLSAVRMFNQLGFAEVRGTVTVDPGTASVHW